MSEAHKLTKTLTVTQAIALGVTIVVGSGLLILPGLAYERVGRSAIYAWLACALIVLPILFIFARLGARFPSAGGVAGFVQAAFGRALGAGHRGDPAGHVLAGHTGHRADRRALFRRHSRPAGDRGRRLRSCCCWAPAR